MKILRQLEPSTADAPGACLAIGMFDGVHLGHQQVIRQTINDAARHEAESVVVTFDRHPATIVAPDRAPGSIYPLEKRLATFADIGVGTTLVVTFDEAFSRKTGSEFVHLLVNSLGPVHSICVGSRFHFGHRRSGNVALLETLGREMHFKVHGLAAVALDGDPISSTRIRHRISEGDFESANQMLGRAYSLCGRVVEGRHLGRTLGFPTANLDVAGLVLPPHGVYAVHVVRREQALRGVINIGVRPTVDEGEPVAKAEVHLFDFADDLYGEELEVQFVAKVRDERKFGSLEELKSQIAADARTAAGLFHTR